MQTTVMKLGVLVTARMGSTRLRGKHLRPIAGRPALSHLLDNVQRCFAGPIAAGSVLPLIATGAPTSNAALATLCTGTAFGIFHGDDNNVPLRHLQAAEALGLDAIVSVDGDDLFCAPQAMQAVCEALAGGAPLVRTSGLPLGMNCWGYSRHALGQALAQATAALLETGWGRIFEGMPAIELPLACADAAAVRATLDYDEDLRFFSRAITEIPDWQARSPVELVAAILERGIDHENASLDERYWSNFRAGVAAETGAVQAAAILPPSTAIDTMSNDQDFEALRKRLHRAIPGGAHTYSRGDDQFPADAPPLLVRGKGAHVWDTRGRRFLDYGMALRAITLGYADVRVNAAAAAEMEKGVNLTRASLTELEASEALIATVPTVEMVKFGKNGSNVTTAAVKIARAYTGRRFVCIPRQHPFFSFDDWFIGTTAIRRGVVPEHAATTLVFDYNDIGSLRALFEAHPGEIAAVMLEPATTLTPCGSDCDGPAQWPQPSCAACPRKGGNFLHQVQALCRSEGSVFILDEMITGFRWHLAGAQTFFGVEPDLTTFGKGMANGFSVAAVGGRRELMEVGAIDRPGMERTFLLSTTHGAEMPGLGAFLETLRIYREEDVVGHLWRYGAQLRDGIAAVARRHGLAERVTTDGPAICLNYLTRDRDGQLSLPHRTLLAQELLARGVMMPWIAISQAHGPAELQQTLEALDGALAVYAQALDGGIEKFLRGAAIRPVFRTTN